MRSRDYVFASLLVFSVALLSTAHGQKLCTTVTSTATPFVIASNPPAGSSLVMGAAQVHPFVPGNLISYAVAHSALNRGKLYGAMRLDDDGNQIQVAEYSDMAPIPVVDARLRPQPIADVTGAGRALISMGLGGHRVLCEIDQTTLATSCSDPYDPRRWTQSSCGNEAGAVAVGTSGNVVLNLAMCGGVITYHDPVTKNMVRKFDVGQVSGLIAYILPTPAGATHDIAVLNNGQVVAVDKVLVESAATAIAAVQIIAKVPGTKVFVTTLSATQFIASGTGGPRLYTVDRDTLTLSSVPMTGAVPTSALKGRWNPRGYGNLGFDGYSDLAMPFTIVDTNQAFTFNADLSITATPVAYSYVNTHSTFDPITLADGTKLYYKETGTFYLPTGATNCCGHITDPLACVSTDGCGFCRGSGAPPYSMVCTDGTTDNPDTTCASFHADTTQNTYDYNGCTHTLNFA